MENCTIYSHQLGFDTVVKIVKSSLPKAKFEINDGGNQKSVVATVKGGFFSKPKTLKINYRQRENPSYKLDQVECGLTQNLAGMVGFIKKLPVQNKELISKFLYKVMSTNSEISFISESTFNSDFESIIRKSCQGLNAFVFTPPNSLFTKSNGQYFADQNFDLLLDSNGNSEVDDIDVTIDAKYHDQPVESNTESQINRKGKSISFLETKGVKVSSSLPCIEDVNDVELRSLKEILDRTYALLLTAAKGEGVEQNNLQRLKDDKGINSLSPKEQEIFRSENLGDQDRAYATWRYESLYTMMWAIGMMEELKYPSEICDVKTIVGKLFQPSREDFESSIHLRSKEEILDELDKTYRMNWACVDARIKGQKPSGNINPSVVYERHYALNWLTKYQDQKWDDVSTDT